MINHHHFFFFLNREWYNGYNRINCFESNGVRLSTPLLSASASCQFHPTDIVTEFSDLHILYLQVYRVLDSSPFSNYTHTHTHLENKVSWISVVSRGKFRPHFTFWSLRVFVLLLYRLCAFAQKFSFHNYFLDWELCLRKSSPMVLVGHSSWLRFNYHSTKNAISGGKQNKTKQNTLLVWFNQKWVGRMQIRGKCLIIFPFLSPSKNINSEMYFKRWTLIFQLGLEICMYVSFTQELICIRLWTVGRQVFLLLCNWNVYLCLTFSIFKNQI